MPDYPNLEPNHHIRRDEEAHYVILCPFDTSEGGVALLNQPTTETAIWSKDADPAEIECPVCAVFNGNLTYVGAPECPDQDGDESVD